MNNYRMTIAWRGITQTELHYSDIPAASLESAERHVLNELNTKKFISLSTGKIIPTESIMEVQIVPEPKPFSIAEIWEAESKEKQAVD